MCDVHKVAIGYKLMGIESKKKEKKEAKILNLFILMFVPVATIPHIHFQIVRNAHRIVEAKDKVYILHTIAAFGSLICSVLLRCATEREST